MENDKETEKTQKLVVISVFLVFCLIGVPVWWKTTEVYRADLPSDEIQKLFDERGIEIKVDIILVSTFAVKLEKDLKEFLESTLSVGSTCVDPGVISFFYNVIMAHDTQKLKPGQLLIKFVKGIENKVIVTSSRDIVVQVYDDISSELKQKLVSTIKDIVVNEELLCEAGKNIFQEVRTETQSSARLQKMVKSDFKFELLFSLLLSEEEERYIDWNIEQGIRRNLSPFLKLIQDVYDLNVGSQVLYSNPSFFYPKRNRQEGYSFVTKEQLSHAVNKIESRLGSQFSTDPTLSMVVHVTNKDYNPVHIIKENGKRSSTNSFLIPRWGAITLHNLKNESLYGASLPVDHLFPVFISHLRVLLAGLDNQVYSIKDELVLFEAPKSTGIALWEVDFLFRLKCVQSIASAVHSMHSLSKLLGSINNIVINDNVAKQIYTAVNAIKKAKSHLGNNELKLAVEKAKSAFLSSETAFFDSTLLELLYFPEDQKFAIYCPLFLPLVMTVVISMANLLKKKKENEKKNEI